MISLSPEERPRVKGESISVASMDEDARKQGQNVTQWENINLFSFYRFLLICLFTE